MKGRGRSSAVRCRAPAASLALAIGLLIAGCGQDAPSLRPFPQGDPAAASRSANPAASEVSRGARNPMIPGHVFIDRIGVNAEVMSLGTEMAPDPFLGGAEVASFAVPPDLARVGWWSDGPRLGARGMAVLLGHSQVGGGYAVFNRLGELRAGDVVVVEDGHGTRRAVLSVTRVVTGIAKNEETALQTVLADNAPMSDLALITCSGEFRTAVSESAENTAVFARFH